MKLGVSYISPFHPEHIRSDIRYMSEIGITEALFAIQENHIFNLTGAVKYGAQIAKDHGITPYAVLWGFANTFGGGRISKFLLENTDPLVEDENGRKTDKACYNHPLVAEKMIEFSGVLSDHGFQGIFVDEPTKQRCYCKYCRELYRSLYGEDLQYGDNETSIAFQRHVVKSYVDRVCSGIKKVNPALTTFCCLMPLDRECWNDIAALKSVDNFGTDPYWLFPPFKLTFEQAVADGKEIKRLCELHNKASHIWLNCWKIAGGLEEEIYTGGKVLAEIAPDMMFTWSFRGGLGTYEECDDPAKAWDSVDQLYRELSGRSGLRE